MLQFTRNCGYCSVSLSFCVFFSSVFASLYSFNFILYFLCKFYIELSSCVLVSVLLHNQLKTRDNAYAPTILLYRIVLYLILLYCVPLLHYIATIFEMTEGLKVMFKALVLAFLFKYYYSWSKCSNENWKVLMKAKRTTYTACSFFILLLFSLFLMNFS